MASRPRPAFSADVSGEELHIRRVPDLDFREDQTLERAFRVEQLLEEIGPLPEDEGGSPPDERSEPLDP